MAFKIERFIPSSPIKFDPKDPYASSGGNKSKYSPDKDTKIVSDYSSYNPKEHSRVRNYLAENKYKSAQGRLSTVKKTTPAPIDPSKPIQGPKQDVKFDTGFGKSGTDFVTGQKAVEEVKKRKKINLSTKTTEDEVKNRTIKHSGKQSKLSQTNLGKKGKQKRFGDDVTMQSSRNNKKSAPKENTLDAINKVSMKSDKFIPASNKSKESPKDNSRKAIRKRKKADKAAGVSKSQMRANKAKSKSEAASAKAKKSKNPSYRAQLTAKSERLAKRAKRKGNS